MQFLEAPNSNFSRVRDGRESMPLYVDIDLSSARSIAGGNALVLNIAGNSFYTDADTTNGGNGIVHFQDTTFSRASAPFFVSPGFIANVPFTQLLIENDAQAGKRMRIFYGVDIDFQAGVNASISISGTVSVSNPSLIFRPEAANGNFASNAALAVNTPIQVFAPAANTNGCILLTANLVEHSTVTFPVCTLLAKNSAPASVTDGEVILGIENTMSTYVTSGSLKESQFIPAGLGLYYISATATTGLFTRCCRWKML